MSRAFLSTCCLTFCLLLAFTASGQRGRKSDMVAPTASACTAAIFWVLIPVGLAGGALLLKLQGD